MGPHDAEGIHGRRRRGGELSALIQFVPSLEVTLQAAGTALLFGVGGAAGVSALRRRGVRVAYTRKVFHIVIFTAAAGVHAVLALPGTLVFGSVVAVIVLAAVVAGDENPFYEALARDKDRPRRSLFIVVPLITTAVGGLVAALLTGPFAGVGYLACGWGDAVGEPAGARWGRHPYRVPSLAGVPATRTIEGSAAVFVVATLGSVVALSSLGLGSEAWWGGVACGGVAAVVEGVSNHGLDNLTVQVAPSLLAYFLFS